MKVRKQGGLTLIGFFIVLAISIFFAYLGMRIVPIYMEYWSVVNAMDGVAKERGSANYTPDLIRTKVMDRLYISYSSNNVERKHMKITRRAGVQLRIAYEVRKPVLGNLDVIAKFDRTVRLAN